MNRKVNREKKKTGPLVPVGTTNHQPPTGIKDSLLSWVADPGRKAPLLSRLGDPSWKTETTEVSQPEQISGSVAVTGPALCKPD